MPEDRDQQNKIIAYLEQRRRADDQRKGVMMALAILVFVVGFASYWVGGFSMGVEATIGALIMAVIAAGVYGYRHR